MRLLMMRLFYEVIDQIIDGLFNNLDHLVDKKQFVGVYLQLQIISPKPKDDHFSVIFIW